MPVEHLEPREKMNRLQELFKIAPSIHTKASPEHLSTLKQGLEVLHHTLQTKQERNKRVFGEHGKKHVEGRAELLDHVINLLEHVEAKDFEKISKVFSDEHFNSLLTKHASIPLEEEHEEWQKALSDQLGQSVSIPKEETASMGIIGFSSSYLEGKPKVTPLGALRTWVTTNGQSVLEYSSPESVRDHENAHDEFQDHLVKEGLSKITLFKEHENTLWNNLRGRTGRIHEVRVNKEEYLQHKEDIRGYSISSEFKGEDKKKLSYLDEAHSILSEGRNDFLATVVLNEPRSKESYHEGEVLAVKLAEKSLGKEFITSRLSEGKKPIEIVEEILSSSD